MKKRVFITIIMAVFFVGSMTAQDVQELLDNHFETIGQEKLLSSKTLYAKGKIMQMGMELPFEMMTKRPDKVKMIINFQGSKIVQAYDGETAWAVNPLSGSADVIEVTGPEADGLKESGDMDGQLWNWEEKGHQLELEDSEEIDGTEMYVLKLTKKNGNIDYYYMDPDSYLITNTRSILVMEGSEIESESTMGNFQEIDGYIMPFSVEQSVNGQVMMTMMIEEVVMDNEYEDSFFAK